MLTNLYNQQNHNHLFVIRHDRVCRDNGMLASRSADANKCSVEWKNEQAISSTFSSSSLFLRFLQIRIKEEKKKNLNNTQYNRLLCRKCTSIFVADVLECGIQTIKNNSYLFISFSLLTIIFLIPLSQINFLEK
jgi:hypothetical protein